MNKIVYEEVNQLEDDEFSVVLKEYICPMCKWEYMIGNDSILYCSPDCEALAEKLGLKK
jgi:hypothetical protein